MTTSFTAHSKCRLCDSGNIEEVLNLGYSPLANAYLTAEQLAEVRTGKREEIFTPLRLFLCMDCGSVQLAHSVDPKILFTDYIYASSTSPVFVKHFEDLAKHVQELGLVEPDDLIVDIGSNDGVLLKAFRTLGCDAIGIEPSRTLAELAHQQGLATTIGFFDVELAKSLAACSGKAKVITACNVFAHLSDLRGFMDGVDELLADDGVFILENSYLGDVVDKMLFDTIYMEHQFYHAVGPLVEFFREIGMCVFRVERIDTHGGSIRVFVDKKKREVEPSADSIVLAECASGLFEPEIYRQFGDRLQCYKHRLQSILKPNVGSIFAYGCPAKYTTFTYVLDLNGYFQFALDDSPLKCNRYTPGSHTEILGRDNLRWHRLPCDMAIVSAWNFFDSIVAKNGYLARLWLRPLPNLKVIQPHV